MVRNDTQPVVDEADERIDVPGVIGMFIGIFGVVNLLAGMAVPLIPWVMSAVLVVPLLLLGFMAKPPLRRWVILFGCLCAVPPVILACVQLFRNF